MLRAGILTFRNNDDFRLALATWGEALEALELLQQQVHELGLDLNGEKSRILRRETYQRNLELATEYLRDALHTDIDFPVTDPYTGAPLEPDEEGEDEEREGPTPKLDEDGDDGPADSRSEPAASAEPSAQEVADTFTGVFEKVAARRLDADDQLSPFERTAYRQATSIVLSILASVHSDGAVEHGSRLVAVDPLLARQFATYLRSLDGEATQTSERVDTVVTRFRGHVPPWAFAWLTEALLEPAAVLTEKSYTQLGDFVDSSAPAVLRARAVLALALHGYLKRDELTALLDTLPPVARPDVVAALALAVEGQRDVSVDAALSGDRLLRWVFERTGAQGLA
jgi:hypothetical protein